MVKMYEKIWNKIRYVISLKDNNDDNNDNNNNG